jgi:hypothetical protein
VRVYLGARDARATFGKPTSSSATSNVSHRAQQRRRVNRCVFCTAGILYRPGGIRGASGPPVEGGTASGLPPGRRRYFSARL